MAHPQPPALTVLVSPLWQCSLGLRRGCDRDTSCKAEHKAPESVRDVTNAVLFTGTLSSYGETQHFLLLTGSFYFRFYSWKFSL